MTWLRVEIGLFGWWLFLKVFPPCSIKTDIIDTVAALCCKYPNPEDV